MIETIFLLDEKNLSKIEHILTNCLTSYERESLGVGLVGVQQLLRNEFKTDNEALSIIASLFIYFIVPNPEDLDINKEIDRNPSLLHFYNRIYRDRANHLILFKKEFKTTGNRERTIEAIRFLFPYIFDVYPTQIDSSKLENIYQNLKNNYGEYLDKNKIFKEFDESKQKLQKRMKILNSVDMLRARIFVEDIAEIAKKMFDKLMETLKEKTIKGQKSANEKTLDQLLNDMFMMYRNVNLPDIKDVESYAKLKAIGKMLELLFSLDWAEDIFDEMKKIMENLGVALTDPYTDEPFRYVFFLSRFYYIVMQNPNAYYMLQNVAKQTLSSLHTAIEQRTKIAKGTDKSMQELNANVQATIDLLKKKFNELYKIISDLLEDVIHNKEKIKDKAMSRLNDIFRSPIPLEEASSRIYKMIDEAIFLLTEYKKYLLDALKQLALNTIPTLKKFDPNEHLKKVYSHIKITSNYASDISKIQDILEKYGLTIFSDKESMLSEINKMYNYFSESLFSKLGIPFPSSPELPSNIDVAIAQLYSMLYGIPDTIPIATNVLLSNIDYLPQEIKIRDEINLEPPAKELYIKNLFRSYGIEVGYIRDLVENRQITVEDAEKIIAILEKITKGIKSFQPGTKTRITYTSEIHQAFPNSLFESYMLRDLEHMIGRVKMKKKLSKAVILFDKSGSMYDGVHVARALCIILSKILYEIHILPFDTVVHSERVVKKGYSENFRNIILAMNIEASGGTDISNALSVGATHATRINADLLILITDGISDVKYDSKDKLAQEVRGILGTGLPKDLSIVTLLCDKEYDEKFVPHKNLHSLSDVFIEIKDAKDSNISAVIPTILKTKGYEKPYEL